MKTLQWLALSLTIYVTSYIYSLYGIDMNPKWFPVFYLLSKKGRKISQQIQEQYKDVGSAIENLKDESKTDLWKVLEDWEDLLSKKSLFERVAIEKKKRESNEVQIVPFEKKYSEAFRELNLEWIKKYFKVEKADLIALDNPQEYILDRGGYIFIALLNGEAVGACALVKRDDPVYVYELAKMAVSPKAQGKRIGWLLGQAIIGKAKELKAERLYIESNTSLIPAITLYKKMGFKEIKGPATPYERCNIQMELKF